MSLSYPRAHGAVDDGATWRQVSKQPWRGDVDSEEFGDEYDGGGGGGGDVGWGCNWTRCEREGTPIPALRPPTPPTTPSTTPAPTPAEASLVRSSGTAAATAAVTAAASVIPRHRTGSVSVSMYGDADDDNNPADAPPPPPPTHAMSPFASARTHTSFAVTHDDICLPPVNGGGAAAPSTTADARSVGSGSRASVMFANARASCTAMLQRCRALGLWRSAGAVAAALRGWIGGVVTAPRHLYQQCKEDPVFASFVAARVDKWCCIISVTLYVVTISVLLAIEVRVGDHKMMLGDRPGNM
ncbi:hypothetical protein VOLCADRAFT_91877 [Volvox carteri f. nagariensis]|uniref:Uncharacterized protein n=1 Tax=Volvox carteri f. nagariensis TaxID=3068 RepID=D8TY69_VOLCA|nr:uncharacterized protein VOLCADRAFT_91877 [Volvox carteri f. nagariensis]EFJ47498.1 hypothetical protein VOLCADRAFT_91877 [Volvox carteri f. nagariensis]|eukprot:XP_002951322.1 hypothetical protein VOLCADRAFT_91877 [Volvox carteri f. nagariensis]